jgi:RNA 2',3'-cyclic 3'-phosphodiesterase
MTVIRSFVSVELPSKFHEEIARIEKKIDAPGLKMVKPSLVHVTLQFLGDVPEEKMEEVSRALEGVKMAPFQVRVKGLGAFPGKSVRVVWLGLEGPLDELHRQVEEALTTLGFEPDENKFSPHLTLARVRQPNPETSRQILAKMAELSSLDLGEFTVDRFYLKKSTLTPGGPIYDNLSEHHLQAP